MEFLKYPCSSEKIAKIVKEDLTVFYSQKRGNRSGVVTPAKIKNLVEVYENEVLDYKFNLMDLATGAYFEKDGVRRVWMLNAALQHGTIKIPLYNDSLKVCPRCERKTREETQEICHECAIDEKKQFFSTKVKMEGKPFLLDDEQADCLLSKQHTIVTARAGSGKTRVLTAKLIDLFFNQGVKEDQVLAFCFNRDAAEEIRKRLNSECAVDGKQEKNDFNIVNTFHAYAKSVLGDKCGQILVDDGTPVRTRLIKQIISELRVNKPAFEEQLRKYFLANTLKIDRKRFLSMEDYYKFVRNSRYRTLKGEHVKSLPEKIIADFLFEHNIKYKYERHFFLNKVDLTKHNLTSDEFEKYTSISGGKGETVPDFYLENYKLVWEHWGITGRESQEERAEFARAVCNYETYSTTMRWKRSFWKYWRYKLTTSARYKNDFKSVKGFIETNPDDFHGERAEIETRLKKLLESFGVKCVKLPEDVIMAEVWKNAEDYFTRQIRQFVDKFQQTYLDGESTFIEEAKKIEDEREKTFLRLGYMVYQRYMQVLLGETDTYSEYKNYHLDFNQCLHKAARKIQAGDFDQSIKQLKWILIDEYQDFSTLFYNLINSILERNPSIKLFCVGDDWQAINRFAGSDLKFFLDFKTYFPDSTSYNIGTNYRCENHIVANAGRFMQRSRISGKPQKGFLADTGIFTENPIETIYFEEGIEDYEWLVEEGGPWEHCDGTDKRNIQAYIKTCSRIINQNPNKKIMILNRKGSFLGKDLDEVERILKNPKLCKIAEPNIAVKTVHRSKGEEADIVILTEVDENCFPIYHSDSNLYSIFGENELTIMEDEARLYYVALTRAKHSIYIFYSQDAPSVFIENPKRKYILKNMKNKRYY